MGTASGSESDPDHGVDRTPNQQESDSENGSASDEAEHVPKIRAVSTQCS
jgi:hypothetical protein